jgi:predicted PurR-regulated permease PerM
MGLRVQDQAKYWGIAAVVFFLVLWLLGDVILPFVLGGAIAYCLDPIADRLERMGLNRIMATTVITLIAILVFVLLFLLVIPTLIQQAAALVQAAPGLFEDFQTFLTQKFPSLMEEDSAMRTQIIRIAEAIQSKGGEIFEGVLSSVSSLINIAVLIVIVPVVAFYLLLDWDNMTARVDALLPRDHAPTIRQIGRDIDATLASFIRGQGTVVLILGLYYGVSLMFVGLNFGLVVGSIAGLISFIPYVGALVGGALALGIALFQFWGEWYWVGAVAVIFGIGQMLEGNVLTPKLVGNSVGLHPVWLLFALSVFGAIFGFVGMLIAVPVAAMIGVVARFGIGQYTGSLLYRGVDGND